MKLIIPVTKVIHQVVTQPMSTTLANTSQFVSKGSLSLKLCRIDFGDTPVKLGTKIERLMFDNQEYNGVTPLSSSKDHPTIADCSVDIIKEL